MLEPGQSASSIAQAGSNLTFRAPRTIRRVAFAAVLLVAMNPAASHAAPSEKSGPAPSAAKAAPSPSKKIVDKGNVRVLYMPSKKFKEIADAIKEAALLSDLMPNINDSFAFPKDIPVVFADCDRINAFYDPAKGDITICYEIVDYLLQGFRRLYEKDPKYIDPALSNAITFIFFHELGHALVDIFDLNITGKEEDAVDQMATVILLELDDGGLTAVHGALAFGLDDPESVDDLQFWDEHSFGKQRFFSILCWVYGSDPTPAMKDAISKKGIPDDRIARCQGEFRRMNKAWISLLAPFTKGDSNANRE